MAISNATRLSDFGSGIGTQGAIIQVDNANQRVGIGTSVPEYTLDVKGTLNATTLGLTNINVTGVATVASQINVGSNIKLGNAGVVTASSFEGSGANLTGVSGFGTAVDSTQGTLGNLIYKTPRSFNVSTGTTVYLRSDATSGNVLFTRLGDIHVGSGATMQIGTGTTLFMDVLSLF